MMNDHRGGLLPENLVSHYTFNPNGVPAMLTEKFGWVAWKYVKKDEGYYAKVPHNVRTNRYAASNDPSSCSDFETAVKFAQSEGCGIGIVLPVKSTPYADIACLDIDDPNKRYKIGVDDVRISEIYKDTNEIITRMDTFVEWSPSLTGLHAWFGTNQTRNAKSHWDCMELYTGGQFITVTGNVYMDRPIQWRDEEAAFLLDSLRARSPELEDVKEDIITMSAQDLYDFVRTFSNDEKFRFNNVTDEEAMTRAGWDLSGLDQGVANSILFGMQAKRQVSFKLFMETFALTNRVNRSKGKGTDPRYLGYTFQRAYSKLDYDNKGKLSFGSFVQKVQREAQDKIALSKAIEEAKQAQQTIVVQPEMPIVEPEQSNGKIQINQKWIDAPTGIIGRLFRFYMQANHVQFPEGALATALSTFGAIVGNFANVDRSGLALNHIIVAETSQGKDIMKDGPNMIVRALKDGIPYVVNGQAQSTTIKRTVDLSNNFEVVNYRSGAAFRINVAKRKCKVVVLEECGNVLKSILEKSSSNNAELKDLGDAILSVFTSSGYDKIFEGREVLTDGKSSPPVTNSAVTILGNTQPHNFYNLVDENTIATGFMGRLLVYDGTYRGITDLTENKARSVPLELAHILATLKDQTSMISTAGLKPVDIPLPDWWQDYQRRYHEYRKANQHKNGKEWTALTGRHMQIAIRIAALLALSDLVDTKGQNMAIDFSKTAITRAHVDWAMQLINTSTELLLAKFKSGETGEDNGESRRINETREYIKRFFTAHSLSELGKGADTPKYRLLRENHMIPHSLLHSVLHNRSAFKGKHKEGGENLEKTLRTMAKNGEIRFVSKPVFADGRSFGGEAYEIVDPDLLS